MLLAPCGPSWPVNRVNWRPEKTIRQKHNSSEARSSGKLDLQGNRSLLYAQYAAARGIVGPWFWRHAVRPKYLLPCSCGQKTPIEATQAGQQVRCGCGATLEVPTMRGLASLERAADLPAGGVDPGGPKPAAPMRGRRAYAVGTASASAWGSRQRVLFIGAVITALGLGVFAVLYLLRPRMSDISTLSPAQTWYVWHDVRQGIERRTEWEATYLDRLAANRRWRNVALGIAGVGVLTIAGSLLVFRRLRPGPNRR